MDILYYYYYLFYTKVLPDDEPHATVVFTLSFSESLLANFVIDLIGVQVTCDFVLSSKWMMLGIFAIILAINYWVYFKQKRRDSILTGRPMFLQSNRASIILTGIFFLATTSLLFWGTDYLMEALKEC